MASPPIEDCDGCLSNSPYQYLDDRPLTGHTIFHFLSECISLHTAAVLNEFTHRRHMVTSLSNVEVNF